jgi:hypothetical protein
MIVDPQQDINGGHGSFKVVGVRSQTVFVRHQAAMWDNDEQKSQNHRETKKTYLSYATNVVFRRA